MTLPPLILAKQADRRLKKGHLWIYSNEVDTKKSPLKQFEAVDLVTVYTASGQVLGNAVVNPNALICGRLFSRDSDDLLTEAFFRKRLRMAESLRRACYSDPFYRLVYGDSDFLPGVVVDRYGDYFVVQLTTAGMDRASAALVAAIDTEFNPQGILLRNNHSGRELEGLEDVVETYGTVPETIAVVENNTRFEFSTTQSQKTGWFYDHRDNREIVQRLAKGMRVLDVYSYLGGWGLEAVQAGAEALVCIDASQAAVDGVMHNAALNQAAEKVTALRGKAIDVLKNLIADREKFDVVILDPPAFIKKRKDQKAGEAAYRHINELGIRLLSDEGILVSASCSMPLADETLTDIVQGAARQHDRQAQLFYRGSQGMDHPVHPSIPETRYIKAQLYRIVRGR